MVIAIDGPSGVGKSTVSRALAAALGLSYLDTGSYYRAATYVTLQSEADPSDQSAVLDALSSAKLAVVDGVLWLDGRNVADILRSPQVTAAVSIVAAHPLVRSLIVDMQRQWVADAGGSAVVEGRDIGTVVFPDAEVKVFLTADTTTRVARRSGDAEVSGATVEQLRTEMERRDTADSTRTASPLRPADDAVTIDTSSLTVAQTVKQILNLVGSP
ncbi:MAG: (d)CMP kinase [Acidimicrobiia bacterium]